MDLCCIMCDFGTSCSFLCDSVYVMHTFLSNSIVFRIYLVHPAVYTLTVQPTIRRDTLHMVVKDAAI